MKQQLEDIQGRALGLLWTPQPPRPPWRSFG